MALGTEPKKDPYYCPECKNYFYHMMTSVYFTACPDCDVKEDLSEATNRDDHEAH